MKIVTFNLINNNFPLYHRNRGLLQTKTSYIELDCRSGGVLRASWIREESSPVLSKVYLRKCIRWPVTCFARGEDLLNLFENEILLERCHMVIAGFEEHWNGKNSVGRFSNSAEDAIEYIEVFLKNWSEDNEEWTNISGSYPTEDDENNTRLAFSVGLSTRPRNLLCR